VDLFLYDCKETDPDRHRQCGGVPQEIIVEILPCLDRLGVKPILLG